MIYGLGERLQEQRIKLKISQKEAASAIGVSASIISKLATTSSTGGLLLALQRAMLLLAPKGGIASPFSGPL